MTEAAALAAVTMREARRDDVARIASLILLGAAKQTRTADEIAEEARHPAYLAAFDEIDASPYNTLFIAELEGEVVGTLQLTLIPGLAYRGRKRAKLESVHIHPDLRGRRIGEAMVAHAVAVARQKGAGHVELTSDKAREAAHRFYRRLGFNQTHEGFKLVL
ncbi:GNAT family N-acetyltransferase [Bosea vestrisii]|uniref:GNAT family N-acetyltransferase n=1 Tax=Bosea vestrisii TaxID=151416 RepID=UPI0024E02D8C|nr:GNAT family N-acetyltransferase [Bosea vestrisii]WID96582.1 GNAT family N-acetyltransferase [Bosea vestrisii]